MKRNDVVLVGKPDLHNFYGRVNRVLPGGRYHVVYCGSNHGIFLGSELHPSDYTGYYNEFYGRYFRMPTLRKLKQSASRYDQRVWKRNHGDHDDSE